MSQSRLVEVRVLVRQSSDPSRCGLVEVDCLLFVSSLVYKRKFAVYVGLAHARPTGIPWATGIPGGLLEVMRAKRALSPFHVDGHG